jgi:hypothetical protein
VDSVLASCYSEVVPVESLRIILANMKLHSYVCGEITYKT